MALSSQVFLVRLSFIISPYYVEGWLLVISWVRLHLLCAPIFKATLCNSTFFQIEDFCEQSSILKKF